jgi:hypothetical protein
MPSRPSVAPPPCSFRAEPSKILFPLFEKIFRGRAQVQKCKEYFARQRALASGGGAKSGRVFVKIGSDFVQKVPPFFKIRVLGDCCLALASLGLGIYDNFIRIFEIQKQFLPAQTEVRFAEGKHKFEKFINKSFFFRQRRKAKR